MDLLDPARIAEASSPAAAQRFGLMTLCRG